MALGQADLRQMPFLLKDGDIIGVRFENENLLETDDFQIEEDKVKKEQFRILKENELAAKKLEKEFYDEVNGGGKKPKNQVEYGIIMDWEDHPE